MGGRGQVFPRTKNSGYLLQNMTLLLKHKHAYSVELLEGTEIQQMIDTTPRDGAFCFVIRNNISLPLFNVSPKKYQ